MLKEEVLRKWKECKEKVKKRSLTKEAMALLSSLSEFADCLFISKSQIDDTHQLGIKISKIANNRSKVYLNNSKLIDDDCEEESITWYLVSLHLNLNSVVLVYEDFLNKLKNKN